MNNQTKMAEMFIISHNNERQFELTWQLIERRTNRGNQRTTCEKRITT